MKKILYMIILLSIFSMPVHAEEEQGFKLAISKSNINWQKIRKLEARLFEMGLKPKFIKHIKYFKLYLTDKDTNKLLDRLTK